MPLTRFQKLATGALVCLLLLICVGAIVRVTGAGLGCPDWPKCWGCLIPPSTVEDIDFNRLPMEAFKAAAAKQGIDPETVTPESLRAEFNARHAWTEYLNRLSATPVSLFTIATFIASFWQRPKRPLVFWMAFASFMLLFANAWVGAMVVSSRLQPVIITTHLALAQMMLGTLCYCVWRGTDTPWRAHLSPAARNHLRFALLVLFTVVVTEGVLGSQVREITDELSKLHRTSPRSSWIGQLEQTGIYFLHRSFSWAVLAATLWVFFVAKRHGRPGAVGFSVLAIVLAQMVLGVIMSQVHIFSWVQVLHVALASVLLVLIFLWLFGLSGTKEPAR